jgi:hypothetical protein
MDNHLKNVIYFLFVMLIVTMGVGFYYKHQFHTLEHRYQYCDLTSDKPIVRLFEEAKEQVSYLTREYNKEKELNADLRQRLEVKNPDVDYYKKPGCYWLEAVVEKRPYPENVTVSVDTTVIYLREGPEHRLGEFSHITYAKKFIEDNSLHECSP